MRLDGEMGERKRIKKKKKVHICQKSSSRLSPPRDHRLHLDAEQKTANILGRRGKGGAVGLCSDLQEWESERGGGGSGGPTQKRQRCGCGPDL